MRVRRLRKIVPTPNLGDCLQEDGLGLFRLNLINRDPRLFAMLRREAMDSVIQMARWKSEGHAVPARKILARIAGYSEDNMNNALAHHEEELSLLPPGK
jgi:hypothetical protein